ncbi:MAG: RNA methyltransferase [Rhodoferax sp.]|nr:RNA methyltransferase [Rhodoferax sp.]
MSKWVPEHIQSAENATFKCLRRLTQDGTGYRSEGRIWVEGEHLCRAAELRGRAAELAVVTDTVWDAGVPDFMVSVRRMLVLPDALFKRLSPLESPAQYAYVMPLPPDPPLKEDVATIILDRVQDAGNVGSILRSAAAFGFQQVIGLKGGAGLWSQKVLRAGMGAHFGLSLVDGASLEMVDRLKPPLLTTSSHAGRPLHELQRERGLPAPCVWAFGHEGQGVGNSLAARAVMQVCIDQPGGEESLNVAAAAAICLYAGASAQLP